jgi:hypothetical protein
MSNDTDFTIFGDNITSPSLSRMSAPKFDSFATLPVDSSSDTLRERTLSISSNPFSGTSSMVELEGITDTIKEQGVKVPLAVTLIKQFQNEVSKFLSEKLLTITKDGELKVKFNIQIKKTRITTLC